MYLAKTMTMLSLPDIAKCFGDRDHTTIGHGVGKIAKLVKTNRHLAEEVSAIRESIERMVA